MSWWVLNVKVYIYVAPSLRDYHGNWGSMLKVSGRQRDLDEPCECGGRDGERVRERESDRGNGSRWRKVRKTRWNAQRSSFNEKFFYSCFSFHFSFHPLISNSSLKETFALLLTIFTPFFWLCCPHSFFSSPLFPLFSTSLLKKSSKKISRWSVASRRTHRSVPSSTEARYLSQWKKSLLNGRVNIYGVMPRWLRFRFRERSWFRLKWLC